MSTGPRPGGFRTVPTPFDDPVVQALVAEVQAEYVVRYGSPDASPVDASHFEPPDGLFLVGWVDEVPVATGAWRRRDADSPTTSTAEIKRMYVPAEHRGKGYARAMLAALEQSARDAGYAQLWLETGSVQPEAIGLYESSGYERIPGFGYYRDSPLSRCYGKDLSATR